MRILYVNRFGYHGHLPSDDPKALEHAWDLAERYENERINPKQCRVYALPGNPVPDDLCSPQARMALGRL